MSGFDFNQIGNMAQGFLNKNNNNNNEQQQQHQQQQGDDNNDNRGSNNGGGFNVGQLAGLAQNFSQGNHNSSLFSQAASFLQNQGGNHNIDEQKLLQDHDAVNNQPGSNSAGQIGNAAV